MDRDALLSELSPVIEGCLKDRNLELVDISCRRQGKDVVLRILVDKPEGGISLDECAFLNKEIGAMLDEKDIVKEGYILELSSPGLDRPLKTKSDFIRCISRKAEIFLNEQINGRMEFKGIINKVEDASVHIEAEEAAVEIPFSKITKAKQVV